MASVTGTVTEASPNAGLKQLLVTVPATADNGDTIAINLANYGCPFFIGAVGFIHTTSGSIMIQEQPTTAVSSGTLTITIGGSTADKIRAYIVYAATKGDGNLVYA